MDSNVTPITVSMIEALRRKTDGVIVADPDGSPLVRSRIHYNGPDPLDTGEQIVVIDGDPAHAQELPDVTDAEIAADLTERWDELVTEARERAVALQEARLESRPAPEPTPVPLARTIAAHWYSGTVTAVQAAIQARIDHLIELAREYDINPDSHVGQQIATERRSLACAKLDLDAVPLARTRLAAARIGAQVCLTCEQLIITDLRSGLWRASQDVFAPGDSCESHDRRHTPEDPDG